MAKKVLKIIGLTSIAAAVIAASTTVGFVLSKPKKVSPSIKLSENFQKNLYPIQTGGKTNVTFFIENLSNVQDTKINIPEFDAISNSIKIYEYKISATGEVTISIDTSKLLYSSTKTMTFSIHCTNGQFNKIIDEMSITINAASITINKFIDENFVLTNCPSQIKYETDFSANFVISSGYDLLSHDLKVNNVSILNQTGVIFDNGKIFIPRNLVHGNIQILASTKIKSFVVTTNVQNLSITHNPTIEYAENFNATYTIDNGYQLSSWDIKINGTSIKNHSDVAFYNGQIFVPNYLVKGNIDISATAVKQSYSLTATNDEGFQYLSTPPSVITYGEDIDLNYQIDSSVTTTLQPIIYLDDGSEQYVSLIGKDGVIFSAGNIHIPGQYVIGNILIYGKLSTQQKILTNGENITFNNIPSYIDTGSPISGTFTLDTNYRFTDRKIYIGSKLVFSNAPKSGGEGIIWDNDTSGKVIIPSGLITDTVTISCNTSNKYSVSYTGQHISYSGSNFAQVGQNYSASYKIDDHFKLLGKDIKVNNVSIIEETGVIFDKGSIFIPSKFITGDVSIQSTTLPEHKINLNINNLDYYYEQETIKHMSDDKQYIDSGFDLNMVISPKKGFKYTDKKIFIGGLEVYNISGPKEGYEDIVWNDTRLSIPGKYVTGTIDISSNVTNLIDVSYRGTHVLFDLPSQIAYNSPIVGKYKNDEGYNLVDYDVLVDDESIKNKADVKCENGEIYIPDKYVTSTITIWIQNSDVYKTEADGKYMDINIPNEIHYKNEFSGTYTPCEHFYLENWDIKVNGISIKKKTGVIFDNGQIFVPAEYVLGDISITANCETDMMSVIANEDSTYLFSVKQRVSTNSIKTSIDGKTWRTFDGHSTSAISIKAGERVFFKGNNTAFWSSGGYQGTIKFTGNVSLYGNITSLLNLGAEIKETIGAYAFFHLFENSTGITTVAKNFLPSMNLGTYCYAGLFSGCTNLRNAPELPATTLKNYCYTSMFSGCTSLTRAPELPATELVTSCYSNMFYNCSSLNYIKVNFTNWLDNATANWVYNISPSGTFYKPADLTETFGVNNIPTNWTVEVI